MHHEFSGGLILGTLFLIVVVAFPIKIGAILAGAKHTGILRCGFTAFVGLVAGIFASGIFGGVIGGPLAAALGFALAIRLMLGTSFLGAIGLMLVALVVAIAGFALLTKLGIIVSAPVSTTIAT